MHPEKWQSRFRWVFRLVIAALFGAAILMFCLFTDSTNPVVLVVGVLMTAPGAIYLTVVSIWHWKERYQGKHSDLWGALLLLETSGWFKLIYLFRHILPDARQRGRYSPRGQQEQIGSAK